MKIYISKPTGTILIIILASIFLLSNNLNANEPAFSWNKDNCILTNGKINIEPSTQENIKFVDGIDGKAIYIPANGKLQYLSNNIIPYEEGTISFWLKLDNSPKGILSYRDRDRLENGDWGNKIGDSPFNRSLFEAGGISSVLNSGISFTALGTSLRNVMIVKRVFADEWHHFAYTWKKDGNISLYIDGFQQRPEKAKKDTTKQGEFLSIGSSNQYKGLEGAIDNFHIYSKALSDVDIRKEYSEFEPLRYELLDYALKANKENLVRFRIRNISDKIVDKNIDIAGNAIKLVLKPNEVRDINVKVNPNSNGLYKLYCNKGKKTKKIFEVYVYKDITRKAKQNFGKPELKLIQEINCAAPPVSGTYTDADTCRIVNDYRESPVAESGIGFSYKMKIKHPGKPHWLEVEYPDNANRAFIVFVYPYKYNRIYTSSLDNIGIITGLGYPITNINHKKQLLFWPDCNEIAVTVVSYKSLKNCTGPALANIKLYENVGDLPVANVLESGRNIGRWQEDPIMTARLWFNHANNYAEADLNYWNTKWQRVIDYMRYSGINNWAIQSMDYFGDASSMDVTLQLPSYLTSKGGRVPGWDDLGAALFNQNKLGFFIRLNPIIFTNSRWFLKLTELKEMEPIEIVKNDGFRLNGFRDSVNILHPAVLKAYTKIIRAYKDKFCKYNTFKGICFNEHIDFSLQDITQGYDDFTCTLFEKETGIEIIGATPSERYQWLMKNKKNRWLKWRCKKVTAFCRALGRVIQENNNKNLKIQFWISDNRFQYNRKNVLTYNPEESLINAGIDLSALRECSGVSVVPVLRPDYEKIHAKSINEEYSMYSSKISNLFKKEKVKSINIFRHSNLEIYWNLGSVKYKMKPFWHPSGTNLADNVCIGFSTPLPNKEFALDIMTYCLAEYDLHDIIHGWWGNVENGEHEAFRKFYTAFRNIPKGDFQLAPGTNDPVAIRVNEKGFYIVNRESYPVSVSYNINGSITTKQLSANEVYFKKMPVYPKISDVQVSVPKKEIEYLNSKIAKLKLSKLAYERTNRPIKSLSHILTLIDNAMSEKRYSKVRHLMYSHTVQEALNQKPVFLTLKYNWLHKELEVTVNNFDSKVFSGKITIESLPQNMAVETPIIAVDNVESGKSKLYKIILKSENRFNDWNVFTILLQGNGIEKKYKYRFPYYFASEEGFEQANKSASFVHSNGHLINKNPQALQKRLKERILGRYALQWNNEGTGLRILADIDDPQYIPSNQRGHMYSGDSIQIYFDQKNNAEVNSNSYDSDDVSFQIGTINGKPEVWMDNPNHGVVDVPVTIIHQNNKTYYDIFIPKEYLPMANLKPGNVIGFGILFNQLMKDENGEFLLKLSRLGDTYQKPGNWQDFYLSRKKEHSQAIVTLISNEEDFTDIKITNGIKINTKKNNVTCFSSLDLTDSHSETSVAFYPKNDGHIVMNINPGYMDRIKIISVMAEGTTIANSDFSERDPDGLPKFWKISGKKPRSTCNGIDIPYGSCLSQKIKITKGKRVKITCKATLPCEEKTAHVK